MTLEHWLLTALSGIIVGLLTRIVQDWFSDKSKAGERDEIREMLNKLDKTMTVLTLKLEAIPMQHVSQTIYQEFVGQVERRLALLEVQHHHAD